MGATEASRAVFFDGETNARHVVEVQLGARLSILEAGVVVATWSFSDLRATDAAPGRLRFTSTKGAPLARLDLAQGSQDALEILARSPHLGHAYGGDGGSWHIVAWSVAAATSILLLVFLGVPIAADLVAPIVPPFLEKRIGDMADRQIMALFGDRTCTDAEGKAAFQKLVQKVAAAGKLDIPLDAEILSVDVPNAMALPGGKVYLFSGLLHAARDPDEIAGVIGHELGHVHHHDGLRRLIESGGSSSCSGCRSAMSRVRAPRSSRRATLVSAATRATSRRVQTVFAIAAMHALGRSPKPMGQSLFGSPARKNPCR